MSARTSKDQKEAVKVRPLPSDLRHPPPGARLVNAAEALPTNLAGMLMELGAGDSRFKGTPFGRGECDLPPFIQECRDFEAGRNLPPGKVPQTTFWLVNDRGQAVGIVRVRHRLNDSLLQYGGHIGYYIRPAERSRGYGKLALRLALEKLRLLGVHRALLTVNPANAHSRRIVLANGGVPDGQGTDPLSDEIVDRFWIDLSKPEEGHPK